MSKFKNWLTTPEWTMADTVIVVGLWVLVTGIVILKAVF